MKIVIDEKLALEGFSGGVNCCATVIGALAEYVGIDKTTAQRIAAGFGGGIGCGSVCGCVRV